MICCPLTRKNNMNINCYKTYLRKLGFPDSAINAYMTYAGMLVRAIGKDTPITQEVIEEYLKTRNANNGAFYIKYNMRYLARFLRYLKVDKTIKLPFVFSKEPAPDSFITLSFLRSKIVPMITATFKDKVWATALLYFIFFTGIRRFQLLQLKRKDIDIEKRTVYVKLSGHKTYTLHFPTGVAKRVAMYFSSKPEVKNAFNVTRPNLDFLYDRIECRFKRLSINYDTLANSFIVHALRCGIDMPTIRQLTKRCNGHIHKFKRFATYNIQEEYNRHIKLY